MNTQGFETTQRYFTNLVTNKGTQWKVTNQQKKTTKLLKGMRNIQINMEGSQILGFKAELREPTLSTALFLYFSYTSQQMHLLFKPLSAGFSATVAKSIWTNP